MPHAHSSCSPSACPSPAAPSLPDTSARLRAGATWTRVSWEEAPSAPPGWTVASHCVHVMLRASCPTDVSGYSSSLREALVPLVADHKCSNPDVYGADISPNMLCAGYFDCKSDACQVSWCPPHQDPIAGAQLVLSLRDACPWGAQSPAAPQSGRASQGPLGREHTHGRWPAPQVTQTPAGRVSSSHRRGDPGSERGLGSHRARTDPGRAAQGSAVRVTPGTKGPFALSSLKPALQPSVIPAAQPRPGLCRAVRSGGTATLVCNSSFMPHFI